MVRMAEMGSRKNVTIEFAPDAEPEIVEAIENLLAINPENITCHEASRYYFDMATCSLKGPAEIYRHTRACDLCDDQVRYLHNKVVETMIRSIMPKLE